MAEEEASGEKTEEATSQRREDFRKQGQVVQTRELSTVLYMFGAALSIWMLGKFFLTQISQLLSQTMTSYLISAARYGEYKAALIFSAEKTVLLIGPIILIFGVLGFASTVLQIGFMSSEEALSPKLDRINPIEGFKRVFSVRSLFEGLKSLLKLILVASVVYSIIKSEFVNAPRLMQFENEQLLSYFGQIALNLFMGVGVLMAVIAIIDYGFNWWQLEKKMKMTKQEVKEEIKSREGDPQIKARIRRIQRDLAQKRMMDSVPKADVIITNPTHIAVAIRYGVDLPAPQVVAKGADLIAEKIKEIARNCKVPIVENKPLARTIFKTIKIGQVIPRELFQAVAEVLAYVYKLKKKKVASK